MSSTSSTDDVRPCRPTATALCPSKADVSGSARPRHIGRQRRVLPREVGTDVPQLSPSGQTGTWSGGNLMEKRDDQNSKQMHLWREVSVPTSHQKRQDIVAPCAKNMGII